jgi:hypothetical protein
MPLEFLDHAHNLKNHSTRNTSTQARILNKHKLEKNLALNSYTTQVTL